MTYNCFRTRFKTKSKSTEDLIKSEVHQGIKLLSKTIKIIKTFLVLKYTKKINSLNEKLKLEQEESNDMVWKAKLEHELKLLSDAKFINHQMMSVLIVKNKIPFGSDPHYNPMILSHQEELSSIDRHMLDTIINDKRLQDNISALQVKITSAIENNNKKRLMNENKKHPTSSKIDCSKAMFVDDLDERAVEDGSGTSMDNSSDRDLRKLNKSLRNQENRRMNKLKRESDGPYDDNSGGGEGFAYPDTKRRRSNDNDPSLSMYRPLDQRLPSNDSNGGSSNKKSMRNDNKHSNERLKKREPNKSKGQQSIVNGGRSVVRNKGSTSSSGDAGGSLDLVKAAAFGKEWQKTGVHPSWAAKQHSKQLTISSGNGKSGSSQSTGKKIIFDD